MRTSGWKSCTRAEEWSGVSEALEIRRNGGGVGDENEGA